MLTVAFVMIAEVFIYAPSVARFRLAYLTEKIASAHLVLVAFTAAPPGTIGPELQSELLAEAGVHAVVRGEGDRLRKTLIGEMPPHIDAVHDITAPTFLGLVVGAFATLVSTGNRTIRVVAPAPGDPAATMQIVLDERPLRRELIAFSWRILFLSIVISVFTAALVYLSLHLLIVRPLRRVTENMVSFSTDPEDPRRVMTPGGRSDELGVAERELRNMQVALRASLRQKARLAALGSAVAKINHDLRNMLTSAQLVSDRLQSSDDPQVRRVAPTLVRSIDRAVDLCVRTLDYTRHETPEPVIGPVMLRPMVDEVFAAARIEADTVTFRNEVPDGLRIVVDRSQFDRALTNLVRNAVQAGASTVAVAAGRDSATRIDLVDDGPGIPETVRARLFQPFAATSKAGGSGLGLAIAREIVEGHGGTLDLVENGTAGGTCFRILLPGG